MFDISIPSDARLPALPPPRRLVAIAWSFGQRDADIFAPFLRLRADGGIAGHEHAEETAWSYRHGMLAFLDEHGRTSAVFDCATTGRDGRLTLLGRKTGADARELTLRETAPAHAGERPHVPARLVRRRPPTGRSCLVVLRANEASLHRSWRVDIGARERTWDLCTSFYGEASNFPVEDWGEYAALQQDERKFQAIRSLLLSHPSLTDYEYFMFPDDDIQTSWGDINATFHAMQRWRLELGQPSLDPAGVINYEATRRDARYHVRFCNMVEVMIPVMSRDVLLACLPTFDLTRSSFGIDYAWSKIIGGDPRSIGIIDDVAVVHTRPTGGGYDMQAAYKEGDALSARYGNDGWFQINVRGGIYR